MNFIIVALLGCIVLLWRKKSKIEAEITQNKHTYQDSLAKERKQNDELIKRISHFETRLAEVNRELEKAKKEIDFYKNIEEDSAELNAASNDEKRQQLVETAAKQILSKTHEKGEQNETENETLLDEEQQYIFERIENDNDNGNYFITGKAGTGKSFLIDVFRKVTSKKHIVLAPTGIAALNISGVTLHSAFGYHNLVKLGIDSILEETIQLKSEKKTVLKEVSTIIIDEISMVRADTLDRIDRILRVVNQNDLPFGGKQILLFGDLFQLPPVTEKEVKKYLNDRYGGEYFFYSDAYKEGNFSFYELTINHRQREDVEYFDLLNRAREGKTSLSDIDRLNNKVVVDESIYDRFTALLPQKAEVEAVNKHRISMLNTPEFNYQAEVVLNKYPNNNRNMEKSFPIANTLTLKVGALVMMVTNDPEKRWVNGTLGIVSKLTNDGISVAIDKCTYEIHKEEFAEHDITYENGKLIYEKVFAVVQYPVVLAYAITIHKAQGQTYKNIVCDISRCFANGQAYVALSRCTSFDGLHLKSPVQRASIQVDKRVLQFYQSNSTNQNH